MRRNRENQLPLSGLWPDHRLAQELKAVSKILDENPSILELVLHDLCDTVRSGQGARGLSAEQVLRAAILKNWHQLSYSQVGVPLERLPEFSSLRPPALPLDPPSASCLQENISRIQASTWQQINRLLVQWAVPARDWNGDARFEPMPRPWKAPSRYPLDSQLLCDAIRVLTRLASPVGPTSHRSSFMITGAGPSDAV